MTFSTKPPILLLSRKLPFPHLKPHSYNHNPNPTPKTLSTQTSNLPSFILLPIPPFIFPTYSIPPLQTTFPLTLTTPKNHQHLFPSQLIIPHPTSSSHIHTPPLTSHSNPSFYLPSFQLLQSYLPPSTSHSLQHPLPYNLPNPSLYPKLISFTTNSPPSSNSLLISTLNSPLNHSPPSVP